MSSRWNRIRWYFTWLTIALTIFSSTLHEPLITCWIKANTNSWFHYLSRLRCRLPYYCNRTCNTSVRICDMAWSHFHYVSFRRLVDSLNWSRMCNSRRRYRSCSRHYAFLDDHSPMLNDSVSHISSLQYNEYVDKMDSEIECSYLESFVQLRRLVATAITTWRELLIVRRIDWNMKYLLSSFHFLSVGLCLFFSGFGRGDDTWITYS